MKSNNFKKAVSYFAIASAFTMSSCQKDEFVEQQAPQMAAEDALQNANKIDGQYIVVFKNNGEQVSTLINEVSQAEGINKNDIQNRFEGRIRGFSGRLSRIQLEHLRNNPDVATIEQDQLIALGKPSWKSNNTSTSPTTTTTTSPTTTTTTTTAPTTTTSTNTFSPLTVAAGETVPAGVQMVGYGDGTGKTAWVIDSGVDVNHPDLNVDVARSISFVTGVTSIQDGYGHGTAVAGVIGAKNNGAGIIGVAANAKIVAVRVLDDAGNGSLSALIKAVNHVSTYGKAGDVMNISIAASASSTLDTAIKNAAAKGIFISIAAGNSSRDCTVNSPQRVNATNVYTVSNMNYSKVLAGSSNYGSPVDRAAPGENVYTTQKGGGYAGSFGSSFSAPHVAGLLLLKGNAMGNNGTITGDKDSWPDLAAKL